MSKSPSTSPFSYPTAPVNPVRNPMPSNPPPGKVTTDPRSPVGPVPVSPVPQPWHQSPQPGRVTPFNPMPPAPPPPGVKPL